MTTIATNPTPTPRRRAIPLLPKLALALAVLLAWGALAQTTVTTDHVGREVAVPDAPQRVLPLHRTFAEDLAVLGVVGVGRVEEYQHREDARAWPSVGRESSPDLEAVYASQPDLILANARMHLDLVEALELTGAAVFFIDPAVTDDDPLRTRIALIASLVGRDAAFAAYDAELAATSDRLRARVAECGVARAVIVQGGGEGVLAAQPTGMYHGLLSRLGLANVVPSGLPGAGRSTWVAFDIEAIIAADPDVVLIRAAGSGETPAALLAHYTGAPEWRAVGAVRAGRVAVLPGRVNPGMIADLEALAVTADAVCSVPGR
jgi:ABC-type Fe3+-hydroxamate transport system substrate-binding protein